MENLRKHRPFSYFSTKSSTTASSSSQPQEKTLVFKLYNFERPRDINIAIAFTGLDQNEADDLAVGLSLADTVDHPQSWAFWSAMKEADEMTERASGDEKWKEWKEKWGTHTQQVIEEYLVEQCRRDIIVQDIKKSTVMDENDFELTSGIWLKDYRERTHHTKRGKGLW